MSMDMCARTSRLGPLPRVCKRFQRLLSDPNDSRVWSKITICASYGEDSDQSYQRFLAFLGSHLHQVEVAEVRQVGGLASFLLALGTKNHWLLLAS